MSEHFFGCGRGNVKASVYKRINKIAAKHGADFSNPNMPGDGPKYWFACPNRGMPFDGQVERAVWTDLESVGLADENGLTAKCFAERA